MSLLSFREQDTFGGGGFADVYRGDYNGEDVAVKCLLLEGRNARMINVKQLQQDATALACESRLMKKNAIHPHVTEIIGCHVAISDTAHGTHAFYTL